MVRQCAWCLRLINYRGEPISTFALPKLYEATHVMCQSCGLLWMEAVEKQNKTNKTNETSEVNETSRVLFGEIQELASCEEENETQIPFSLSGGRC